MYRQNKKKLAITVLMFFVTLLFSNFTSISASADTINEGAFQVNKVSTSTSNQTNSYNPIGNGVSVSSGGALYFRMDFQANNPQPGDKITFTLPAPLAKLQLIHYPDCFNAPTINGDTVTLVANNNIEHVIGGYLTIKTEYDASNSTKESNIPIVINGNKTTIKVTNTTYNPNENGDKDKNPSQPVNPIDEGGSIVKTVNGQYNYTIPNLNNTNNIVNYKVQVNTTKMTVNGVFEDNVTTAGVSILPNTIKVVNDATGQDITSQLKPNMTVNSSYEASSIKITNFPKGGQYTITYKGRIDIDYPGIKDTTGHYLYNTATIGGASSTASIYGIEKANTLTPNEVKNLTSKTNGGSSTYSNLGEVKQFNLCTNYNNYILPPGTTVSDTMPEGLILDPTNTLTQANVAGPSNSTPQGPINIIYISKSGVETKGQTYDNAIANLYVNYQLNKIELITNVPTNNSFWINYNTVVTKPFKASITNTVTTKVGNETGTASASIHYSASDGVIKAWKSVNKQSIVFGENPDVQYTINVNSVGSFPTGYLNIKDPLEKDVTFENVQLPQGFKYTFDAQTNTLNITNTEPIIGTQGAAYNGQIIINASLKNAKDGTTVDNTAIVNGYPTNTVKTKKGYAFIATKEAEGTNKALEGAVYGVYNSSNQELYPVTSDANGVMTGVIGNPGQYYLKEITAPKGYLVSTKEIPFNVTTNDIGTTIKIPTIYDKLAPTTGNIKITKTNESGQVLQGATFAAEQNGKTIQTATTNKDGVAEFTGLPIGSYNIVEIKAPTGYEKNNTTENVNVVGGQTTEKGIIDKEIKGSLEITKTSSTGQKLQGAIFEISGPNGYSLKDATTGPNGVVQVNNLAWGTYTIKEIQAPVGYTLNSKTQTITIGADNVNKVQDATFVDQELLGQLQITKEGPNQEKLQGAEFTVAGPNGFKEQTVTTNANGVASLSGLPWGTYTVTETKAPQGYELNKTPQQVVISNASVGGIQNLTFKDNQKVGSLQVIKEGPNNSRLQGAEFTVTEPNGVTKVISTNKDGVASLSDLAWGTYTVQETKAPAGYSINTTKNTVTIDAQNVAQTQVVTVIDGVATGTLVIEKTDITNEKEVAGATIQIQGTSISGEKISKTFVSGTTPTKFTLPAGTYTYTEVDAPVGYQINKTVGHFTISEQGQIVKADVKDARVLGQMSITKTGKDGVRLAGAEFTITEPNGETKVITTNKDGVASLGDLAWGSYTVQETKAPVGYALNNEVKTVTIDAKDAQQTQEISVNDGQILGQLQITKTNANETEKLKGAEFTVTGPNGFNKVVTTDKEGVANLSNLAWGTYTVQETKAPEGYQLNGKQQQVVISNSSVGGIQSLTFKDNQKLGSMQIVKTGLNNSRLQGAEFTVTGPNSYKEVVTTNAEGVANLKDLAWGTYKVQETKAPAGYNLDENIQTVNINAEDVSELQTVTINDAETTGTLVIEKTDITNEKEVAGAKIQIQGTSDNGQKVDIKFTSGTTPTKFTLPAGTYTYTEVDAPTGYQINKTVGQFTISKQGQIVKADVKDARVLGQMSITKTNENGTKKLEGAQFTVTGPNGFDKVVTTNAEGVANLKDLVWGTYTVKETKAPIGYAVNNTVQTVNIDASDAAKVQSVTLADGVGTGTLVIEKTDITNEKEVAGAKIQIQGTSISGEKISKSFVSGTTPTKFTLPAGTYTYTEVDAPTGYQINKTVGHFTISEQGQIVKADVKDARILGSMQIIKTGINGTKLKGAEFTVTGPNGFNKVVTTDNDGVANLKDLAWGTYTVKETKAPVGYNLSNEMKTVVINADDAAKLQTVTVNDVETTGTLVIEKTDITNEKEVAGAKIQIQGTSDNGQKVDIKFTSGTTPTKFTLPAGTYTYTEVDAPTGYQINKTVGQFTISKQGQIVKADVKDARVLGQMSITKTNENGTKKLQGAEFTVTGPNGFDKVVTTNAEGVANLKDLVWGTYTVKETKAPIGYAVNNAVQTVVINAQDAAKVQNVTVADGVGTGTLVIEKTDITNEKEVAGATIQIQGTSISGEKISKSFVSGTTPTKFTLPAGTYTYTEVDAPVGYQINKTVGHFTISEQGQIVKADVKDARILGSMQIVKTGINGTKLEGAQFTVTGPNGFKKIVTTDKDGVANLKDLAWGTYTVKETKAPAGYNLNTTSQTVKIDANDAAKLQTVAVNDEETTGTLVIEKTDITNEKEVAGAKIQIQGTSDNGQKVDIKFTSGTTPTKFTLPAGTYTYTEVDAPVGYQINKTVGKFTISKQGQIVKADVKDARVLGQISITKTGKDGIKLEGAEFTVTGPNGFDKVVTTNKDGVASLDNLAWGTYTVKETKAPIGYNINTQAQNVTIDAQDAAKVQGVTVSDNQILGQISITKTNENGTKKLEGAEFTVTGPNGFDKVVTTNKDGVANLKDLAWGTYTIKETKAPIGYNLNPEVQTVEVTAASVGKVQSVTEKDTVTTGTLNIEKTDITNEKEVAGAKIQITGKALDGQKIDITFTSGTTPTKFTLPAGTYTYTEVDAPVGYLINKTVGHFTISEQGQIVKADVKDARVLGQMTITKTNENGTKKLEGAEFTVTGPNGFTKVVTTNKDGVANLKDLAWGTYKVQETKAPIGYNVNPEVQTVNIEANDAAKIQALTEKDTATTGTLVIEKTDVTNEKEVAGAKIQITGTSVLGKKIDITFTSGTTPTKFTLPAGTYTYTEVDAPVGYLINKTVGHFTISEQGQIVKADVKDARILGQMTITKTNENGTEKLEGAQFTVTGPNGFDKVVTTNKDGVANLKDLAWGTYTVKETKAPIGYSLNNDVQTVKIDAQDAAKVQSVSIKDAKILGQISITKTNENGTVKLQGAEFTVTGPNDYKEVVTTNKDGVANLKDLAWGTYKVQETKAPVGYSLNNEMQTVEVTAASVGKVQSVSVKDNQILGNLTITKTNENGTEMLQGAEFKVTGPNGFSKVVTTGANGIASLSNLEWGTYYVKEIKAPQGYNINNTIYTVNINAQDALQVQAVKVKDSKIQEVTNTTNHTTNNNGNNASGNNTTGLSPQTSDASQLPIYVLLAVAIIGLVINTRRKKKLAE